jgi:hypothetical protein
MRQVFFWAIIGLATLTAWPSAFAQAESAAEICNASGVCAPVDPLTALAIVGAKVLTDELNKGDKSFGPNGAVVKAVNTVLNDLRTGGLGENNDLVRAFESIRDDLMQGLGKNNAVIRALSQIGVKF